MRKRTCQEYNRDLVKRGKANLFYRPGVSTTADKKY